MNLILECFVCCHGKHSLFLFSSQILLAHGAPLFVRNIAGQTPCDAAGSAKQLIVAKLLESRMVLTVRCGEEGEGREGDGY